MSSRGVYFQCKDSLRSAVALEARLGWGVKFGRILWLMAQAFVMFGPRLAFVVWLDGKAQIGDEGDDGLFADPVGVERYRHLAFGIG